MLQADVLNSFSACFLSLEIPSTSIVFLRLTTRLDIGIINGCIIVLMPLDLCHQAMVTITKFFNEQVRSSES